PNLNVLVPLFFFDRPAIDFEMQEVTLHVESSNDRAITGLYRWSPECQQLDQLLPARRDLAIFNREADFPHGKTSTYVNKIGIKRADQFHAVLLGQARRRCVVGP